MSEYIEREAVVERINNSIRSWSRDYNSNAPRMVSAYKDVLFRIQSVPTAVKFIETENAVCWECEINGKNYGCSLCKNENTNVVKAVNLFMPQIASVLEAVICR